MVGGRTSTRTDGNIGGHGRGRGRRARISLPSTSTEPPRAPPIATSSTLPTAPGPIVTPFAPSFSAAPSMSSTPSTSTPTPIPSAPSTSAPLPAPSTSSAAENSHTKNELLKVEIKYNCLSPGHDIYELLRQIFLGRIEKGATRWKKISEETKRIYFEEFEKNCVWSPSIDAVVRRKFKSKAARRYSDIFHEWKKLWKNNQGKPEYMSNETWASFISHWEDPHEIAKAEQNNRNRLSEPAGEGTGVSCHKGGSRAACDYAIAFEKKHNREPNEYEIFLGYHPPDKEGKCAYAVAENVHKAIQQKTDELSQMPDAPPIDMGNIFRCTVESKKGRIFGIGNLGERSTSTQSSFTQAPTSSMFTEAEFKRQLDEKIMEMRTQMQVEMQSAVQAQIQAAVQAQVQQVMEVLRGGSSMASPFGGDSTSGVGHNDIDVDADDEVDLEDS